MKVRSNLVAPSTHASFRFITEASTLGLKPGVVPTRLHTDMGNTRDFILQRYDEEKFVYEQQWGCISLHVYND